MKKNIWVVCSNRTDLIEAQRRINAGGALRAFCMLSYEAVEQAVSRMLDERQVLQDAPSLILIDYETGIEDHFKVLGYLQAQPAFAGVPLFFMADEKRRELDEECYEKGATVVLRKPFSEASLLRIERAAWQHEMTRSYERILQQQASELQAAREIKRLNEQLASRNRLLHQIFGKYFSDEVVDVILDNPKGADIGGKKSEITVMMADLRGFTSLSERLSADAVVDILNYFLGEMTQVIMAHQGTVIEFIGDAILAVFGAPIEAECSQGDAIAAAIEMQNRMRAVNEYNARKEYPTIETGIGIHKGEVFIGNIGSERLMRYNVIGQAVNLCSRVESYSVGGQILVTRQTLGELRPLASIRQEFLIAVKGIGESIPVCEIIGLAEPYSCGLTRSKEEQLREVRGDCFLSLFVLQKKMVDKVPIKVRVMAVSRECIRLQRTQALGRKEESGLTGEMGRFTNVELVAEGHTRENPANAYAKVMELQEESMLLHFTYLTEAFLSCVVTVQT